MRSRRVLMAACIQGLYAGTAAGFVTALACDEHIIAALLAVVYSLLHAMWRLAVEPENEEEKK